MVAPPAAVKVVHVCLYITDMGQRYAALHAWQAGDAEPGAGAGAGTSSAAGAGSPANQQVLAAARTEAEAKQAELQLQLDDARRQAALAQQRLECVLQRV